MLCASGSVGSNCEADANGHANCFCIADLASQAGLFSRPHYLAEKLAYVDVGMLSVGSDAKK